MSAITYVPDAPTSLHFKTFLENYRQTLHHVFHVREDIDEMGLRRGLPPFVMQQIQACEPLSVYISTKYGGRGGHIHEGLAMLAASSYESLALSLTMGINGALFLQPLSKYGQESAKEEILGNFLDNRRLGGLMITEPDYGSDALSMQTSYVEKENGYHLNGIKHWGGLTGWADHWLLTARARDKRGNLARDIDFFICDVNQPGQHIEVEEVFENLGLYMIPYGRNRINVTVPKNYRLEPESTGIKMMLDLLHRSRTQFPGMGMGFLKRLMDEGIEHCKTRFVGGKSLFNYDQVQQRLTGLQAAFTACSAMCTFASENAGVDKNLSKDNVSANAIKATLTDLMQHASQSLLQLVGAKGYTLDHIAGRATVDSRSFQIFEGSNDILYQQISESVLKSMRRIKENNLYTFLKSYDLTSRAADYFKDALSFEVDSKMPQRKLVDLGKLLGRVITMELTIELGERGFRSDLIANCLAEMKKDAESFLSSYQNASLTEVVENYIEESAWLNYVRPSTG